MQDLYEHDFVRWSAEQAGALRAAAGAGVNAPIDWMHVAEEIESLGVADRRALSSHVGTVIEHLLKLEASPATEPVRNWRETVRRARREIRRLLDDSPSLHREVPAMIAAETPPARLLVLASSADFSEQSLIDIDRVTYTEPEVLGDWFPEQR